MKRNRDPYPDDWTLERWRHIYDIISSNNGQILASAMKIRMLIEERVLLQKLCNPKATSDEMRICQGALLQLARDKMVIEEIRAEAARRMQRADNPKEK